MGEARTARGIAHSCVAWCKCAEGLREDCTAKEVASGRGVWVRSLQSHMAGSVVLSEGRLWYKPIRLITVSQLHCTATIFQC